MSLQQTSQHVQYCNAAVFSRGKLEADNQYGARELWSHSDILQTEQIMNNHLKCAVGLFIFILSALREL